MKRRLLSVAALAIVFAGAAAHAEGYGTAGCGLGALVFKDQKGPVQIFAATTNDYFGQTFAITSGTSNCVDTNAHEEAALFITVNQAALQKDISRGNGETLASLSKILKCSDNELLNTTLQKSYGKIFSGSQSSGADVTKAIDGTIQSDQQLVKSCKIYG